LARKKLSGSEREETKGPMEPKRGGRTRKAGTNYSRTTSHQPATWNQQSQTEKRRLPKGGRADDRGGG